MKIIRLPTATAVDNEGFAQALHGIADKIEHGDLSQLRCFICIVETEDGYLDYFCHGKGNYPNKAEHLGIIEIHKKKILDL